MKKMAFMLFCFFAFDSLQAQQNIELAENIPYQYNGLEYGYSITNEKSKEVKGEDYDRYEIVLFVTNKSGGIRLFPFGSNSEQNEEEMTIVDFTCRNATGKRLTSKTGKVNAKPWFTDVKIKDESQSSKYKFVKAQVGYAIMNGQTISNKIVVIVPKGERPKFSCRPIYFPSA